MSDDNDPMDPVDPIDPADPTLPPTEPMPATPPPTDPIPPVAAAGAPLADDPNTAIPNGNPDPRWYDDRAVVGAVIAIGLLGLFLLIGWLVWWSDDDDDEIDLGADSSTTAVIVEGSTVSSPTTIPDATITEGSTIIVTAPESTVAPTTAAATTVAPTTAAPTTAAPTPPAPTTAAPTTAAPTTAPPTTAPATTTTVPVVTVPPSEAATVFDIIANSPDLSRLNQLIEQAGLQDELGGDSPLTLFAPSNPAIETLEAAPGGAELLADDEQVRALLLRHVVPESLTANDIFAVTELTSASGDVLPVDAATQTVDGATLIVTDVGASNGVLQVVDQVLLPG